MPKSSGFSDQAATGGEHMAKNSSGEIEMSPVVDQTARTGVVFRLTVFVVVLTIAALLFAVFQDTLDDTYLLIVLAILAMIAVGFRFALTIGFVQFAPRATGEVLSREYTDSMNEGLLVTDERLCTLYVNRA